MEGDGEGDDALHRLLDEGADGLDLGVGDIEEEFVVDLEGHAGLEAALAQFAIDADHGELDDVGGGALDGHIDGDALGGVAGGEVAGGDFGDVAAAAEEGLGVAALTRLGHGALHIGFDGRVVAKVGVDKLLGLLARDAQTGGQAEGGDAVDDAEVDHLAVAALPGGDRLQGNAIDGRGGLRVNILAAQEGAHQALVAGHRGHQAELDLGVVGREQLPARAAGDEGGADALAAVGAHGDVLEVGVGGGEAPGVGEGLVEGGVDAAVGGADVLGEAVDIGVFELHAGAPIEEEVDDGVAVADFEEELFVGGILAAGGALDGGVERQFAKEELAHLLGAGEVDASTGEAAELQLQADNLALELVAEAAEGGRVEPHAQLLHLEEDLAQRLLALGQEFALATRLHLRPERGIEAEGGVGPFAEGRFAGATAGHRREGLAQGLGGHVGELVAVGGLQQVVLEEGVVDRSGQFEPGVGEEGAQGLRVVDRLGAGGVFQQRAQRLEALGVLLGGGGQGEVSGLSSLGAEGQGGQVAGAGRVAGIVEGDGNGAGLAGLLGQSGPCVGAGGGGVGGRFAEGGGRGSGLLGLLEGHGLVADHLALAGGDGDAQAVGHLVELVLAQDGAQARNVERRHGQVAPRHLQGHVALDGDQALAQAGHVGVGADNLAELAGDLGGVGEQVLHRAVLLDQARGGLGAHAGNARDVIAHVAGQGEVVDELGGEGDVPLRADLLGRERGVLAGAVDADALAGELAQILVGGGDDNLEARLGAALGEGAQDVVGLVAIEAEGLDAPGFGKFLGLADGGGDVLGHLLALGFVGGIEGVAEGGGGALHRDGQVGGLEGPQDLVEGGGEERERGGVDAGGRPPRLVEEDEVAAIENRHQVDEEEALGLDVEGRGVHRARSCLGMKGAPAVGQFAPRAIEQRLRAARAGGKELQQPLQLQVVIDAVFGVERQVERHRRGLRRQGARPAFGQTKGFGHRRQEGDILGRPPGVGRAAVGLQEAPPLGPARQGRNYQRTRREQHRPQRPTQPAHRAPSPPKSASTRACTAGRSSAASAGSMMGSRSPEARSS